MGPAARAAAAPGRRHARRARRWSSTRSAWPSGCFVTRFCPRCGEPLEPRLAGHELVCANCGTAQFPRTDPAVIMVVTSGEPGAEDERCLLGRQAIWPEGRYSTLAGFCEPGETLEDAVRREVLEEIGVVVGEVEYFGNQPWPLPASLMLGFVGARRVSEEINVDDDEIEDARWFTRAEMKAEAEAGDAGAARRRLDQPVPRRALVRRPAARAAGDRLSRVVHRRPVAALAEPVGHLGRRVYIRRRPVGSRAGDDLLGRRGGRGDRGPATRPVGGPGAAGRASAGVVTASPTAAEAAAGRQQREPGDPPARRRRPVAELVGGLAVGSARCGSVAQRWPARCPSPRARRRRP